MKVKVNGKDIEISKGATLQDIVDADGMDASKIVLELNKEIVPKDRFTGITVSVTDTIEILSFVGGG